MRGATDQTRGESRVEGLGFRADLCCHRRMRLAALTLLGSLLLGGCGAPASRLPAAEVLRFGVGHMGGYTRFVVRGDGSAEYWSGGRGDGEVHVRAQVTAQELDQLAATLRRHGFCSLRSGRSVGVPDEARPAVSVRLGGLDCAVQMWDGEFRDDEGARAALAAIEALGQAIHARGQ